MRKLITSSLIFTLLTSLGIAMANAQPPGVTMEDIMRQLPLEGAPLAEPGKYEVSSQAAHDAPRYLVFHPADLSAFPGQDNMPLVLWGNGGCNIDGTSYSGFLETIASHGFLVMTTTGLESDGEDRSQNAADLSAAIDWAEAQNTSSDSPLYGKIDTSQVAVMGQSCGGALSITLGADPRVTSVGVFNSGLTPRPADAPPSAFPGMEALDALHGPVFFVNGHEVDFMYEPSRDNFEHVDHVPAFYGARENAGHTATMYHPGGGEFANVASNWLLYHFKGDSEAGQMFVGDDCELCTNDNWETASKGL